MIILMLLESGYPTDTRVENEVASLVQNGFEVHLLCYKSPTQNAEEIINGATIHRFDINNFIKKSSVGALSFPIYFNFWKKKIRNILEKYRIDVIHIHDLPLIKVVVELVPGFRFKIVLDLHENWPGLLKNSLHTKTLLGRVFFNYRKWVDYEAKYIQKADRVITVIDESRDRIQNLTELTKIYVIPNTINLGDINTFTQNAEEKTFNKFIYEGGITYHRGLQVVLEASKIVKNRGVDFKLWVVGSGSYLKSIESLSADLDLNEHVSFFGRKSQKEVYSLLNEADFALIPHLKSEHTDTTIPHKLFHYMYMGLPIIASDCNPLKRIVIETSSGLIYNNTDSNDLARIMIQFISDKDLTNRYNNSRKWIESKYNWKFSELELLTLYSNL